MGAGEQAARVLPTAEELAQCFYREDELRRLKGIATGLGDTEAVTLFEAAIQARRRLEVAEALDRPRQHREMIGDGG